MGNRNENTATDHVALDPGEMTWRWIKILQMHPEKMLGSPPNVVERKHSAADPLALSATFDRIDYFRSRWRRQNARARRWRDGQGSCLQLPFIRLFQRLACLGNSGAQRGHTTRHISGPAQ